MASAKYTPVRIITPSSLTFATAVGTTAPRQQITLTVPADGAPILDGSIDGNTSEFPFTTTCVFPINPGTSCSATFTFIPSVLGQRNASVTLNAAFPGYGYISLTGNASQPLTFAPSTVEFTATPVGTAATRQTVTVTNPNDMPVLYNTATIVSAPYSSATTPGNAPVDFSVPVNNCPSTTLAPHASCTFQIAFLPTASGIRSAQLAVSTTANGAPQFVQLAGTGGAKGAGIISTIGGVYCLDQPQCFNKYNPTDPNGDGGPATSASFSVGEDEGDDVDALVVDRSGNVYLDDPLHNSVRKIDTTGTISTLVTGGSGYSKSLAVDTSGNVYVGLSLDVNHGFVIEKVDTHGTVTILAGGGTQTADGVQATDSKIFADGIAVDGSGNLYFVDSFNYVVRKVDTKGVITTVAGNGTPGFSGDGGPATSAQISGANVFPRGIAVDAAGDIYISDYTNARIRKVDLKGTITTVAGGGSQGDGGPAVNASLGLPFGITLDGLGNLYIADEYNSTIRKVTPDGTITTIAGSKPLTGYSGDGGPATSAGLRNPFAVGVDGIGNVYIADTYNSLIRKITY